MKFMEKRGEKYGAKKIAVLALLTGFGLIAFMIEALLPSPLLPGAKLGLSNVFSLFALVVYGLPEALLVVVARTVLGSIFAGNLSLLLYSLTAGVISTCISRLLLLLFPHVSLLCVSVISATVHNIVQLFVYCALTQTLLLVSYSPYLCLLGAGAGIVVGLTVIFTVKAIPLSVFKKIGGRITQKNKTEESS
jgi:heptaprenyl diphosphate synthase